MHRTLAAGEAVQYLSLHQVLPAAAEEVIVVDLADDSSTTVPSTTAMVMHEMDAAASLWRLV